MQATSLGHLVASSHVAESHAQEWADRAVLDYTEELDERLRRHRPRAGRIEEGVRLQRAGQLVAQRRLLKMQVAKMVAGINA